MLPSFRNSVSIPDSLYKNMLPKQQMSRINYNYRNFCYKIWCMLVIFCTDVSAVWHPYVTANAYPSHYSTCFGPFHCTLLTKVLALDFFPVSPKESIDVS